PWPAVPAIGRATRAAPGDPARERRRPADHPGPRACGWLEDRWLDGGLFLTILFPPYLFPPYLHILNIVINYCNPPPRSCTHHHSPSHVRCRAMPSPLMTRRAFAAWLAAAPAGLSATRGLRGPTGHIHRSAPSDGDGLT